MLLWAGQFSKCFNPHNNAVSKYSYYFLFMEEKSLAQSSYVTSQGSHSWCEKTKSGAIHLRPHTPNHFPAL